MTHEITVTLRCVVDATTPRDLAYAIRTLRGQSEAQFPMINGSQYGLDGSFNIRCLGVADVSESASTVEGNRKLPANSRRRP